MFELSLVYLQRGIGFLPSEPATIGKIRVLYNDVLVDNQPRILKTPLQDVPCRLQVVAIQNGRVQDASCFPLQRFVEMMNFYCIRVISPLHDV